MRKILSVSVSVWAQEPGTDRQIWYRRKFYYGFKLHIHWTAQLPFPKRLN